MSLGNKSKISSLTGAHQFNTDFDKLINDMSHGRLKIDTTTNFDRPAYYGTSQSTVTDHSEYDGRRLYAKTAKRGD